jgi:hypothetical protein
MDTDGGARGWWTNLMDVPDRGTLTVVETDEEPVTLLRAELTAELMTELKEREAEAEEEAEEEMELRMPETEEATWLSVGVG